MSFQTVVSVLEHCGFQHSPSVTEILSRFPVEPWELECCSFLDSNYSSCTIGLGCDWTGKHQARHWQKLFTVSLEYLSFLPVFLWLPNSAFFCRMHGCAFFTVEHLWEGFEVLQRSHHPEQREGIIYVDALHGDHCSGKQKAMSMRWFTVR